MGDSLFETIRQIEERLDFLLEQKAAKPDSFAALAYIKNLVKDFKIRARDCKPQDGSVKELFDQARICVKEGDVGVAMLKLTVGLKNVSEDDTERLCELFTLRAEAQLAGRQFEACARDAQRALSLVEETDDVDVKRCLYKTIQLFNKYAGTNLGNGATFGKQPDPKVPEIETPNPMVPCASDALLLVNRRFLAARNIKPGEVLLVEEPLASFANLDYDQGHHCGYCFKNVDTYLQCDYCNMFIFCDEQCMGAAHPLHSDVCALLPRMDAQFDPAHPNDEDRMQRVLWLLLAAGVADPAPTGHIFHLGVTTPLECGSLDSLLIHCGIWLQDEAVAIKAALTPFTRAIRDGLRMSEEETDELIKALELLVPGFKKSFSGLKQIVLGEDDLPSEGKMQIFGAALCPVLAMVTPSCSPNAVVYNVGNKFVVQATRLILRGSLVTRCLDPGHDFLKTSFQRRRDFFSKMQLPECRCEACCFDWPTLDRLLGSGDDPEVLMLVLQGLDERLLPFALAKAEEMERCNLQVSREFHLLQVRIRALLMSQGNVCHNGRRPALEEIIQTYTQMSTAWLE